MALQCLTWIPELWNQLIHTDTRKTSTNRQLPDDVVFEILTRLPPGSVVKCRKVCKQWLTITSSPYFVDMLDQKKTASFLLVQIWMLCNQKPGDMRLFIFDEDSLKFKRIRAGWVAIREKVMPPKLVGCCNTKLVFTLWSHPDRFYLCSLLTREIVAIEPPKLSVYLAIFFHPIAREYRLLFYRRATTNLGFEIFIYSCGSKTWRELPIISYKPCLFQNHVALKGNLHWVAKFSSDGMSGIHSCMNSLIMFNTDTEKFSNMPHPGRVCKGSRDQHNLYLLEMEGLLCFGNVEGKVIWIWVLEDYENWTWTLRYNVDLKWDVGQFPFMPRGVHLPFHPSMIHLWNIRRGKLMISWLFRGLFQYHLEQNIVEKLHDHWGGSIFVFDDVELAATIFLVCIDKFPALVQ